jgi:hypothetical protein
MSVAGYIGKNVKPPRKLRDFLDDRKDDARRDVELKSLELERATKASYESVADYDPVLRAHCRL